MSNSIRPLFAAAAAAMLAACDAPTRPLGHAPAPPRFSVTPTIEITDLGALATGASYAVGINDEGVIVGVQNFNTIGPNYAAITHAVLWHDGVLTDLGTLPGGEFSRAFDINNMGQIVGEAVSPASPEDAYYHAFLWQAGVMTDLHTSHGADEYVATHATAINDLGQVVGWMHDGGDDRKALLWQGGVMSFLTGHDVMASDINNNGQIVGRAMMDQAYHPVLWQDGALTDLGSLGGEGEESVGVAFAINDKGQVVGWSHTASSTAGSRRAFLWENGVMTNLGALPGHFASAAYDINDHGQIVGTSEDINGFTHAVLWQDGAIIDLGTTYYPQGVASAINNNGQIVGSAWEPSPGNTHHRALLWTVRLTPPTPEQQVLSMETDVQQLERSGALAPNHAEALSAKLDATTRALNQENTQAAINLLSAFINQVQAFVQAGKLAAADGAALMDQANSVIAQLRG